jgi:hypothetical protein
MALDQLGVHSLQLLGRERLEELPAKVQRLLDRAPLPVLVDEP